MRLRPVAEDSIFLYLALHGAASSDVELTDSLGPIVALFMREPLGATGGGASDPAQSQQKAHMERNGRTQ